MLYSAAYGGQVTGWMTQTQAVTQHMILFRPGKYLSSPDNVFITIKLPNLNLSYLW